MSSPAPPPPPQWTLVLRRDDVRELLDIQACIDAVEDAFRQRAVGRSIGPRRLRSLPLRLSCCY